MQYSIAHSIVHHFADDTNLLLIHKSPKMINKLINNDLTRLCNWFRANKISLNANKTEIMIYKPKSRTITKKFNFRIRMLELKHVCSGENWTSGFRKCYFYFRGRSRNAQNCSWKKWRHQRKRFLGYAYVIQDNMLKFGMLSVQINIENIHIFLFWKFWKLCLKSCRLYFWIKITFLEHPW